MKNSTQLFGLSVQGVLSTIPYGRKPNKTFLFCAWGFG
jgi:hypothetical protein